ncbi:hypothetical protein PCANC_08985 [Puccinia coronata f. sp. avenae]|uniref:Uncharacterized protein n=1 Tax=Puccinia coronata f. sp. avenae TaxID=200324 RepID=A0A2N5VHR4_9BASI|nr:hypothetical protein PCANC_08985 [Puccinia coronata f. sp. avenae]
MKMFGFAINNWISIKLGFSNDKRTEPSQRCKQEKSSELQGLPPSYESLLWTADMKKPCIQSATHLPTPGSKKAYPTPARPFPKDWKSTVGPQTGFLKSSGYSTLFNENVKRRS